MRRRRPRSFPWRSPRSTPSRNAHAPPLIADARATLAAFPSSAPERAKIEAYLASLEELIKVVRDRVGRVNGQKAVVQPHRNINPPRWPTDCPGDEFPYSFLRRF